jgi:hypothetical protein
MGAVRQASAVCAVRMNKHLRHEGTREVACRWRTRADMLMASEDHVRPLSRFHSSDRRIAGSCTLLQHNRPAGMLAFAGTHPRHHVCARTARTGSRLSIGGHRPRAAISWRRSARRQECAPRATRHCRQHRASSLAAARGAANRPSNLGLQRSATFGEALGDELAEALAATLAAGDGRWR